MCWPVITGCKSEKEKFAGADHTYTMEAMMLDGRALQMGTSHNLGQNFAKGFNIQFLDRDGKLKYPWQTSWGTSTRMIGGLIMVHGDDRGLKLPPKVAPVQCRIIPIAAHKEGVLEKCGALLSALKAAGIRAGIDDRDQSAGWKFNDCELKGIPVRLELGPKDMEKGQAVAVRRDTFEKIPMALAGIGDAVSGLLKDIHTNMLETAREYRIANTVVATDFDAFKQGIEEKKVVKAMWCGDTECELAIKEETGATTRCMPFEENEPFGDVCVHCGKPAKTVMYFAKAY